MAINLLTDPLETPATIADWQNLTAQMRALALAAQGAARVSGSNIVKGAVFLVGGALYVAAADTAISGSASDYVKLTVAVDGLTLTPSFVADLTGVTWSNVWNGYYDVGGNLYEFDEKKALAAAIVAIERFHGYQPHGQATFLASGSLVVPIGITEIIVTGCAAGGNGSTGGGGGGGEWLYKKHFTGITPGSTLTVTIGSHAAQTTIFHAAVAIVVLNPGADATGATYGAGGTGGNGTAGGKGGAFASVCAAGLQPGGIGFGGGGSFGGGGRGMISASSDQYTGSGGGGYGGGGGGGSDGGNNGGAAFLIVEW